MNCCRFDTAVASGGFMVNAADIAVEVSSMAYRRGGGTVLYQDHPLNQCFRDAHAATQHVHVTDEMYELVGAYLLGDEPD